MQKRIEYIDTAKAILIIFVVLGHIIQLNTGEAYFGFMEWVLKWIHVFHMQSFLILTGVVYDNEKYRRMHFADYFIKKVKTLIIPMMFFETLGFIVNVLFVHRYNLNIFGYIAEMDHHMKDIILTGYFTVGANWYLLALFIAEMLLYLVNKFIKKRNLIFVFTIFCIVSAYIPNINIIVHFLRGMFALGFILIGNLLKETILKVNNIKITLISFLITITATLTNGYVTFMTRNTNNLILYVIGGIAGTFFINGISKMITSKYSNCIGKNTLPIMGTHQICIAVISSMIIPSNTIKLFGIICMIVFLSELAIVPLLVKICPFFIGEKSI